MPKPYHNIDSLIEKVKADCANHYGDEKGGLLVSEFSYAQVNEYELLNIIKENPVYLHIVYRENSINTKMAFDYLINYFVNEFNPKSNQNEKGEYICAYY